MRSDTDVGLTSDVGAIMDICSGLDDGSMPDGDIISDVCSGMDIGMESDLKALRLEMFSIPFVEFRIEWNETERAVSRGCRATGRTHDSVARRVARHDSVGLSRQDSGVPGQVDCLKKPCLDFPTKAAIFDDPNTALPEQVDDEPERPDIGIRFCGAILFLIAPEAFDNPPEPGDEPREAVFGLRVEMVFEIETSAFEEIADGRMLLTESIPGLGEELREKTDVILANFTFPVPESAETINLIFFRPFAPVMECHDRKCETEPVTFGFFAFRREDIGGIWSPSLCGFLGIHHEARNPPEWRLRWAGEPESA